jgi:hypothetical protein
MLFPGDILVVMGAGDIYRLYDLLDLTEGADD